MTNKRKRRKSQHDETISCILKNATPERLYQICYSPETQDQQEYLDLIAEENEHKLRRGTPAAFMSWHEGATPCRVYEFQP